MKKIILVLLPTILFVCSISSMEYGFDAQKFYEMQLDPAAITEFVSSKRQIKDLCVAQAVTSDNNLFAAYSWFADASEQEARAELAKETIAAKLHELEERVITTPDYQFHLRKAQKENTPDAWRDWRFKSGADLVTPILTSKGFIITEPKDLTFAHVTANKDISEETAYWIMAHSVLLYKNRQLQRLITGQDLPPIVIR